MARAQSPAAGTTIQTDGQPDGARAARGPATPRLHRLADRIETLSALDPVGDRLAAAVRATVRPGRLKGLMSGSWLGHPVHPVLTDMALSAWVSAALLDVWGGEETAPAADRLVAAGIAAAVPTALTGMTDWGDTVGGARRVGLVHAAANSAALTLYSASYGMRRAGRRRAGLALGFGGAGAVLAGAFLGGHIAYSRGVGVNQTAFEEALTEWTPVLDESELPDGQPVRARTPDGVELLVLRRGTEVFALSNRCTHRGGALHEGEVDGDVVTCPLHGSRFCLRDGAVVRGPASAPEPAYETRVREGRVEVRLLEIHRERAA